MSESEKELRERADALGEFWEQERENHRATRRQFAAVIEEERAARAMAEARLAAVMAIVEKWEADDFNRVIDKEAAAYAIRDAVAKAHGVIVVARFGHVETTVEEFATLSGDEPRHLPTLDAETASRWAEGGVPVFRRTRTSCPDRVTEWEPW